MTDRRDAILRAVAFTGERLLQSDRWQRRVDDVLGELGRATGVDRVYVFAVRTEDGVVLTDQLHEWASPGVAPQADNPDLQGLPFVEAGFGRWERTLRTGGSIAGAIDDLPASEQELLRDQDIRAIAAVPVHVAGRWWGFVGYDLVTDARPFEAAEVAALGIAADILGAAIAHEQQVASLERHRERLAEGLRREREATDRLRDLDRMKSTFLDAVSHELRTPLTGVLGISAVLAREDVDLSPDERRNLAGRLTASAERLDDVLAHLLDLNRLRSADEEVRPRTVDVAALLVPAVAAHDALAPRRPCVSVDAVEATVDPAVTLRVLRHLLDNASVHTDPEHRVWVHASPTPAGGLHLTVEDDGPGIPGPLRRRIFEPFAHGVSRRPHAPGTGVGLSLVAGLARLHDGRAWCDDRPGGGAAFHVVLEPVTTDAVAGHATGDRGPRRATEQVGGWVV